MTYASVGDVVAIRCRMMSESHIILRFQTLGCVCIQSSIHRNTHACPHESQVAFGDQRSLFIRTHLQWRFQVQARQCTPTDKHAFDTMQFGVKAHEPHAIAFVDAKLVSLDSSLSQMNRTCYDNRRIPLYKMCHINRPMILTIVRVPYIGAGILRQGSLSVASLCDHVVDTRLVLCCPMCHISN